MCRMWILSPALLTWQVLAGVFELMREIPNMEMRHLRQWKTGSALKGHLPPVANGTRCPCKLAPCAAVACYHNYPTVPRRGFQVSRRSCGRSPPPDLGRLATVAAPGVSAPLSSAAGKLYQRTQDDKAPRWKVPPPSPVCWSSSYHCGLHHTALYKQAHGRRFATLHMVRRLCTDASNTRMSTLVFVNCVISKWVPLKHCSFLCTEAGRNRVQILLLQYWSRNLSYLYFSQIFNFTQRFVLSTCYSTFVCV